MHKPKTSSNPATRRIHPAENVSNKFTQYIPAFQNIDFKSTIGFIL